MIDQLLKYSVNTASHLRRGGVDEHVANFLNSTVKDLYKNNADKIKFVTNRKVQDIAYLFLNTNAACALNLSKKNDREELDAS